MPELQTAADGFLLDGEPFRILSGALHYFRVHPDHWQDRLRKARGMGLNTVDTYIPWNLHEPVRGSLRMAGGIDLPRFLDLAAAEGLHVLLRPGPYICGEWEGGGLPSWLLAEPGVRLRSTDPRYLDAVDDYFGRLLPLLDPYLSTRGGPVIAVQVENEYGAYGDDRDYLEHLAGLLRRHGVDVPLFTCDQPGDLARGGLPGVLATVNFGSGADGNLALLRAHQPQGPLMVTEFWNGWFDRWGGIHTTRPAADAAAQLDTVLAAGASVSFYMFHGGTNFGFTNGANDKHTYRATVTSYDYDAPLTEAGDPTPKYAAFREVIARHAPVPDMPLPAPSKKLNVLDVRLPQSAPLLAAAGLLGPGVSAERPRTMEELGQDFGFVLYSAALPAAGPVTLEVDGVADRAQVFVEGQPAGVLERESHHRALAFTSPAPGARLDLLVENQGRVNYGQGIHDRKGILGDVRVNGRRLQEWTSRPLDLADLAPLAFGRTDAPPVGPAFHRGVLALEEAADTYLDLTGWTKGNAWINGFHLGRYWSRGPQSRLYVPGPVLRAGDNEIVVLELHATTRMSVDLRDTPDLGPTEE
ncbi:beta-galactosidase [Streptomyces cocklensis]|jgi:beta-galactosidase|uniref:Beta-galactosidase n=1 Tax=Actinacidiphila cocklensis TaxID=887465 RepID=A0A9W4DZN8_9ACTN|nr:beta-galactosidase family protein [Actinacidiphila cocklensis]MDD1062080.1 beta-galactosidase [Actinacidiphila cocklensis]WSX74491.1 beta-galactosidase [Streptomyces sp. NBC_00899]CAG6398799.1 Beta-galactosidase [Actinacidiphila cocklensis]